MNSLILSFILLTNCERYQTMEAYEFKTKIKNGLIQVPKKYTQKVGNTVKVIILSDQKDRQNDIVDELLKNPVEINNFMPFSRDEIYERH